MNSISAQTIVDGARNTIIKVDVSLDGSGDFTVPQTIVNPALLSPIRQGQRARKLRVQRLEWFAQDGLSINLFWDGAGSAPLWRMTGRAVEQFDGLQNNADQPSGKITMTTTSSTASLPLVASFKIHCVKKS